MSSGNLLLSRRALLAGAGALAVAGGAAGCARNTASASVDSSAREELIAIELGLMSAYEQGMASIPAGPELRRLQRRRAMHEAHLRAIGVEVWTTPSKEITGPTDASPAGWVRWLAQEEAAANLKQTQIAANTVDTALARTAALISAAERTHGIAVVNEVSSREWRTVNAGATHLDALEDSLESHYIAMWVIGRVGFLLNSTDLSQVRKHFVDHQTMRDRVRRVLSAAKRPPAGPAPVYQLSRPVGDQVAARTALRDMERNVIAAWLPVMMAAHSERDPASASAAIVAMGDAAVRSTRWGNNESFPGFGEALTPAP